MIKNQTYSVIFNNQDIQSALLNNESILFIYPYNGDVFTTHNADQPRVEIQKGIHKIMDQFDDAWRELAQR